MGVFYPISSMIFSSAASKSSRAASTDLYLGLPSQTIPPMSSARTKDWESSSAPSALRAPPPNATWELIMSIKHKLVAFGGGRVGAVYPISSMIFSNTASKSSRAASTVLYLGLPSQTIPPMSQRTDEGLGNVVLSNFNPAIGLCPRGDVGVGGGEIFHGDILPNPHSRLSRPCRV